MLGKSGRNRIPWLLLDMEGVLPMVKVRTADVHCSGAPWGSRAWTVRLICERTDIRSSFSGVVPWMALFRL